MPVHPKFDRETKILVGVWIAFMLWTALSLVCQLLIFLIPLLRESIAPS